MDADERWRGDRHVGLPGRSRAGRRVSQRLGDVDVQLLGVQRLDTRLAGGDRRLILGQARQPDTQRVAARRAMAAQRVAHAAFLAALGAGHGAAAAAPTLCAMANIDFAEWALLLSDAETIHETADEHAR